MHLILDFQDNEFSLEEKKVQESNTNLTSFFKFREKEKFPLEELVKLGISTIQGLHDLVLRGYITQEAREKIQELLIESSKKTKCI
jgi:hypothetical protein